MEIKIERFMISERLLKFSLNNHLVRLNIIQMFLSLSPLGAAELCRFDRKLIFHFSFLFVARARIFPPTTRGGEWEEGKKRNRLSLLGKIFSFP